MKMKRDESQYYCSVTLCVLGDNIDPEKVTSCLGIQPSRSFRKGEHPSFVMRDGTVKQLDIPYACGGWKLYIAEEKKTLDVPDQIDYWCDFLTTRQDAIRELKSHGYSIILDCFITTKDTAEFFITSSLQRKLSTI